MEDDNLVDGYGVSFPPEVQERHAENVIRALHEHEKWLASQEKEEYIEPEWKDKPAGWQSKKGSGV